MQQCGGVARGHVWKSGPSVQTVSRSVGETEVRIPETSMYAPPPVNPCSRKQMCLHQQANPIGIRRHLGNGRVNAGLRPEHHFVVLEEDPRDEAQARLVPDVPALEERLLDGVDRSPHGRCLRHPLRLASRLHGSIGPRQGGLLAHVARRPRPGVGPGCDLQVSPDVRPHPTYHTLA